MVVVMSHGRLDQVATPDELYDRPGSQFVAKFMGDNNIFSGKVKNVMNDGELDVIQLEIENWGIFYCRGYASPLGTEAACSVRPDLLHVELYNPDIPVKSTWFRQPGCRSNYCCRNDRICDTSFVNG